MRSAGVGLAEMHCKYHVAYRARHGSYWCPTYTAADLKPYLKSAAEFIKRNRAETFIAHTILCLQGLLDGAGRAEPAQDSSTGLRPIGLVWPSLGSGRPTSRRKGFWRFIWPSPR